MMAGQALGGIFPALVNIIVIAMQVTVLAVIIILLISVIITI